jgi:hypothetical protein
MISKLPAADAGLLSSMISLHVSSGAGMPGSASVKRCTGNSWRRKRDEGTFTAKGE